MDSDKSFDIISEKKTQLEFDCALDIWKNYIADSCENNESMVMSSVIFSWFEHLSNFDEFENKYSAFKQISNDDKIKCLFDIVLKIDENNIKDDTNFNIISGMGIYKAINDDEELKNIMKIGGYNLPDSFRVLENYLNGKLKKKVEFFYKFESNLDSIYYEMKEKGYSL